MRIKVESVTNRRFPAHAHTSAEGGHHAGQGVLPDQPVENGLLRASWAVERRGLPDHRLAGSVAEHGRRRDASERDWARQGPPDAKAALSGRAGYTSILDADRFPGRRGIR